MELKNGVDGENPVKNGYENEVGVRKKTAKGSASPQNRQGLVRKSAKYPLEGAFVELGKGLNCPEGQNAVGAGKPQGSRLARVASRIRRVMVVRL
jgi:hypothetical protein